MAVPGGRSQTPRAARSFVLIEVAVLAILWLLFSGKLDALHLSYGVLSIGLTAWLTHHLIVARSRESENEFLGRMHWGRAASYPFWMLWQILVANIEVAKVILGPRSRLNPRILRFDFPIDDAIARVVLGNSITITPGTFTLRIRGHRFLIHSIDAATSQGLIDGDMQRRVADVFGRELPETSPVAIDDQIREEDRAGDE